jgi:hypothetical protein
LKTAITINDKPVEVPSDWSEITYGQYLRLKDADTDAKVLHVFTGVDSHYFEDIAPNVLQAILLPTYELGEVPTIDEPLILGKSVPTAIGKMEYARKVNCDNLQKKYEDEEMVGRMVAIYCADGIEDEDIEATHTNLLNEPITQVMSAGKVISDQLIELQKSEEKIPSPQYESEELRAGIKEFAKYGVFGLVRGIALRHGCTMEDVYKWSYNSVLLELRISAEENAYQRKLNKILSKQK